MDIGLTVYHRFLNGDEQALEELINIYRVPLTAFINGFVKEFDTAESLMIDVFVELVRSKGAFREKSNLKTYLFTIGRNKALRYLKKRKLYHFVPLEEAEAWLYAGDSPEEKLTDNLQREALHAALEKLHPEYREILYLLYFEELSYQEAAVVMKKNQKQIANLAYRARQSLKTILEKERFE